MVPSSVMELDSLPLMVNGKTDRKALPAPDLSGSSASGYRAPGTEMEKQLVAIWEEMLGIAPIGIDDNFFEIGGHSLLAMRVISIIKEKMNVAISLKSFFDLAEIKALAKYIKVNQRDYAIDSEYNDVIKL
jgi:acyl carrier protein